MKRADTRSLVLAAVFLIACASERTPEPTPRRADKTRRPPPARVDAAAQKSTMRATMKSTMKSTMRAATPAADAAIAKPAPKPRPAARPVPPKPTGPGKWKGPLPVTGVIDGKRATGRLIMYLPPGYSASAKTRYPLVIALHGWGHSARLFQKKGDLARWADQHGFVLAVPEMGKTIYETKFYPQSRGKWKLAPGARWVGEVILPHVRKNYAVYQDRAHTGVLGYSTGGRGAVLLAALYPQFAFAGSVSGTYDLMILKPGTGEYKIHQVVYGSRARYPKRWKLDNCIDPPHLARLKGVRLYIVHGGRDRYVPVDQLAALRKAVTGRPILAKFHLIPKGGHDWKIWKGSWKGMFAAAAAALRGGKP